MKKILHVHGGMALGGTESVIMNWYRHIDSNLVQFDFTSSALTEQYHDKEILERHGKIHFVEPRQDVGIIRHCLSLYRTIKNNGPYDVIHSHDNFHGGIVSFIATLAGVKIRVTHSHSSSDQASSFAKKAEKTILRLLIFMFATERLACTEVAGKYMYGTKMRYSILKNAVDIDRFRIIDKTDNVVLSQLNNKYKIEDKTIIGHVGRLAEEKNHRYIIEMAEILLERTQQFVILLVGDGPLFNEIKNLIVERNLENHIYLLGNINDIEYLYNTFDILLLPSHYEGFPLVIVEAQSCGLPSIVSNSITHKIDLNLNLVTFIDTKKENLDEWVQLILSNTLKKQLDSKVIKKQIVSNGFSIDTIVKQLLTVYKIQS